MQHFSLIKSLVVTTAILCAVSSVWAIKITIPKEYERQIEAAKKAEQTERNERIRAIEAGVDGETEAAPVARDAAGQSDMEFSVADEDSPADGVADETDAEKDFLTGSVLAATETAAEFEQNLPEGQGFVAGQIVDKETSKPISGVAILLEGTDVGTITDTSGRYRLGPAPAGEYTLSFIKSGYIEANVTEFAVIAEEVSVFPFALPPRPAEMSDEVYVLQDFSVTAAEANQLMANIELRMDSDSLLNILSGEDFSKFAASDVGEAIKRVSGVTVEGGQFAVIRGLDERYSSTMLNGVPVPSPDPDRQSVPLDLFPSDVVKSLSVSKTFTPDMPGNSAGGSIGIATNVYPEAFQVNASLSLGRNRNVDDVFLRDTGRPRIEPDFSDVSNIGNNDPLADLRGIPIVPSGSNPDPDMGLSVDGGGTFEFMDRDIRVLASLSTGSESDTLFGEEDVRFQKRNQADTDSLDFSTGVSSLTESAYSEQTTYLVSLSADLDTEGDHTLGSTFFSTEDDEQIASFRQGGYPEKIDQAAITGETDLGRALMNLYQSDFGDTLAEAVEDFNDTGLETYSVIDTVRKLDVQQLEGAHRLFGNQMDRELNLSWVVSRSETELTDFDSVTASALVLPLLDSQGLQFDPSTGGFITPPPIPAGQFLVGQSTDSRSLQPTRSWRRIVEDQDFARVDADFELPEMWGGGLKASVETGYYDETTTRDTEQIFFTVRLDDFAFQDPQDNFADAFSNAVTPIAEGNAPGAVAFGNREIDAFYFNTKLEVQEKLDLILGLRLESVLMSTETNSDGEGFFNFEILREQSNPGGALPSQAILNTQILGLNNGRPLARDFQGEINEDLVLPSLTLNYRPFEGARATFAVSKTSVRPSFKEFTFLTVRDPFSLDYVSGNPALELSDVTSYDLRLEYNWGEGDMVSLGAFYKEIDQPIEKTTLSGQVVTEIFFNNPNQATVMGLEAEFRKQIDFIDNDFLQYFSVGGNLALIDAKVDVQGSIMDLFGPGFDFDSNADGSIDSTIGGGFRDIESERGLVRQPEWLVNADISFEQPDWGTRATLSVFGQSRVLDTAAGFNDIVDSDFSPTDLATFNEYEKAFFEVNFTLSQQLNENWRIGFTAKNLTDSERGIEYEDDVNAPDRTSFKLGRSYSVSVSASF